MSLTNLLAVGRSVIGIRSEPTRYKMTQDNLLPKFAPVGRPVSLAPITQPEAVPQVVVAPAREPQVDRVATEDLFAPPAPIAKPVEVVAQAVTHPLETKPVKAKAPAQPVTQRKLESLADARREQARKWFKNPFAGVGKAKSERTLVQTELLLEQVKVVRNDLSEADIEVVPSAVKAEPVTPAPAQPQVTEPQPVKPMEPATANGWSRLTAKLFNANHARF